jgi:hypothetical protein
MRTQLGALSIAFACMTLLGAYSLVENKNASREAFKPIDEFVKANDEQQSTDDQEIFLLEQETPEGEIFESGSEDNNGSDEALEKRSNN